MALKAGRVGVAPDQVDEFGHISSEATSGYTKQEADAKFETQTHAASTYETKSDAATLQPITLSVPIEMLSGTKLTVESALNGLNESKIDNSAWTSLRDITPSTLSSLGVLQFAENPKLHLMCIIWTGNSETPNNENISIDVDDYATEIPIAEMYSVMRRGDCLALTNTNTAVVHLTNNSYSKGFLLVPTKNKEV